MARLQRVDEMHEPPNVGQFYLVPSIQYRFGNDAWLPPAAHIPPKLRHWPVMGIRHEDAEHIGFPYQHYHMDWRFASDAAYRYAMERNPFVGSQAFYGTPLYRSDMLEHGPVTHRRMKCKRVPPINTVFSTAQHGRLSGGQKLHRAWFGKPAIAGKHGWVCPHRFTPLGSAVVEPDGSITCPLHGLKFCAKTGASIATHDMTAK